MTNSARRREVSAGQFIAAATIRRTQALGTAIEGAVALAALGRPAAVSTARGGPVVAVVRGGTVDTGVVQRARQIVARMRLPESQPEPH